MTLDDCKRLLELKELATTLPWLVIGEAMIVAIDRPGEPLIAGIVAKNSQSLDALGDNWAHDAEYAVAAANAAPELAAIALLAIELGEALRPFADLVPGPLDNVGGGTLIAPTIKVRWIKEAREVLAKLSLAQEAKP